MPEKNQKTGKEDSYQSDYITNKVLLVFSLCLLGVLGLMFLSNVLNYTTHWQTALQVISVLRWVGVGIAGIGVLRILSERKQKLDYRYRVWKGITFLVFGLAIGFVFSLVWWNPMTGIKMCYVILPAFAFYYLIYHSYQPEFFVIALDSGLAVGAVLFSQTVMGSGIKPILLAGVGIAFVLQLIGVSYVRDHLGRLRLGKRKYVFTFTKNAYIMMYLTPVVMAGAAAAGLLLGGKVPLASMIGAGTYFFVTAVYYTVKLV